jgi:glycosyltransferase involved in cell wall biosynthesis
MLLSICIPIYNADICPLAIELHRQIQAFSSEVELLFLDDASDVFFQDKNRSVGQFSDYQELPINIGRSKIRNAFLPFTKGTYLLFIDGDSKIIHPDFVKRYVECLRLKNTEVLIGASIYSEEIPERKQLLRWTYSRKRESKSFSERNLHPELGFKSNNFVILKSLFAKYSFDESLVTYGHEDTLFGYQLRIKGVSFQHIDNPVLNSNLDDNDQFLEKTKEALKNLLLISLKLQDTHFNKEHRLLSLSLSIEKNRLFRDACKLLGALSLPILTAFLKKGYFTLWMFDLYRIFHMVDYLGNYRKNKVF